MAIYRAISNPNSSAICRRRSRRYARRSRRHRRRLPRRSRGRRPSLRRHHGRGQRFPRAPKLRAPRFRSASVPRNGLCRFRRRQTWQAMRTRRSSRRGLPYVPSLRRGLSVPRLFSAPHHRRRRAHRRRPPPGLSRRLSARARTCRLSSALRVASRFPVQIQVLSYFVPQHCRRRRRNRRRDRRRGGSGRKNHGRRMPKPGAVL